MILHLAQCLSAVDLEVIHEAIHNTPFYDGKSTAGRAASEVKHNQQADDVAVSGILRLIEQRLLDHDLFKLAVRPQQFVRLMLSRYQPGMAYGTHVDEALINDLRTDISFTVFLSASDSYQGGELVLEDNSGERSWKPEAGDVLLYPSTYLHRVNLVEKGVRLVVVGWLTSRLRDAGQRELLFDLELALREEFNVRGKTPQYDRLSKVRNNLLRLLIDR
ncbi:MAG: Fe2+-dependent dioxygenase [Methylophaga sp.]|nr:Fe2+-dependent dioxygenase [Methylophaga sp.]